MLDRQVLVGLARRALDHHLAGTTDQAATVMEVPIEEYADAARWSADLGRVLRRVPLMLGFSCELPGAGDFKALEAAGVPVLLVRGSDGVARAFINVCRHRGTVVCEARSGNARRFTCPYHAWVYDDRGALVGMFGADSFGAIDRASHGLVALPCEERAGLLWVSLTPDVELRLDEWLGALGPELDAYQLDRWTVFERLEIPGPGWKVAFDGYIELYHLSSLHPTTVGLGTISNLMVVDTYGPHQRIVTCRPTLGELAAIPEDEWKPWRYIDPSYVLFPNVQFVGAVGGHLICTQVLPGDTADRTVAAITVLLRRPPADDEERARVEAHDAMLRTTIQDEDYRVGAGIQRALRSGANIHLTLGRNELTLQHQHRWIERLRAEPW